MAPYFQTPIQTFSPITTRFSFQVETFWIDFSFYHFLIHLENSFCHKIPFSFSVSFSTPHHLKLKFSTYSSKWCQPKKETKNTVPMLFQRMNHIFLFNIVNSNWNWIKLEYKFDSTFFPTYTYTHTYPFNTPTSSLLSLSIVSIETGTADIFPRKEKKTENIFIGDKLVWLYGLVFRFFWGFFFVLKTIFGSHFSFSLIIWMIGLIIIEPSFWPTKSIIIALRQCVCQMIHL